MAFYGFLASANVLKDAVQDLVAQVGHADVDVITWPLARSEEVVTHRWRRGWP